MPQSVFIQTISGGYATEDEELPIDVYNPTDIDVILRPDFSTIRSVPWYEDPTAQVICDAVNLNGTHVINSSRSVLKILKLFDELGYEPIVSPEVEFYLVKPNPDSDYPLEVPIGQSGREETGKQAFGIDAVNEFDNLFEDVYNFCEDQNIEIDTINHESGSAQMEINFQHGDPLELADQVYLFKRTLRQAAIKHKLYATFMAKPMENQPGSSLHLHQSLIRKKNKKNVFFSKTSTISNLMKNYIAGLQTYTPNLMPIHAPNINSYRRLFATWDAPRNTNWGLGNRSCGFRIPSNEEHSMRIENRISGADTNPYLVFAANLAAGYLGIKNKLKPTPETKKSVFGKDKSSLPKNVEEAILLFENDEHINEVFNQKFIRTIAAIRRVENQAYLKVVSSWEREYLLLNV